MKHKFLLLTLMFAHACGISRNQSSVSRPEGHFEDKTQDEMRKYEGAQKVIPEHGRVEAVLVSHQLVREYQRGDFLKAMLDAGLQRLYVMVPKSESLGGAAARESVLRAVGTGHEAKVVFVESKQGSLTVWARDWAPLVGHDSRNGQSRLVDFNYYPRRAVDDAVPSNLEATFPGWERVSVPVYNEGGNFMSNGRMECLMTTRVTDANARKFHPDDIILDAAGVRDMYSRYAGCSQTHIFPRMPSEGTGHIDMWGKFLTDDDVIVGRITSERMTRFAAGAEEAELVRNVAAYLDERAEELAELGYKVHRVPMPLPSSNVFRSYTNSLLLNGTAFVPRYGGDGKDQVSPYGEKWSEEYEAEVVSIYGKLGFQVQWVDSDELIESGGAVHCVTMQFGKLP